MGWATRGAVLVTLGVAAYVAAGPLYGGQEPPPAGTVRRQLATLAAVVRAAAVLGVLGGAWLLVLAAGAGMLRLLDRALG